MRGGAVAGTGLRRLAVILALVASAIPAATPARAASDGYAEDPIGLVPYRDSIQRAYSGGQDEWEVWVCDVPGWSVDIDPASITDLLNQTISPYFLWLSGFRYTPVFRAGGVVSSNDIVPTDDNLTLLPGCERAVQQAVTSAPAGVIIVADGGYGEGYGTPGRTCPPFDVCWDTYPDNLRRIVVGAGSVTTVSPEPAARLLVVAHEIGHAIGWAHSYGGLIIRDGSVTEYDNVVDVMSAGALDGLPVGTHAYNRYAAGWIDPAEVAMYRGGTHTYRLESIGGQGYEMVALPLAQGYAYTFGLRNRIEWDVDLAKHGVEAYLVDSRSTACDPAAPWLTGAPCWGLATRISPVPAPATTEDTSHVLGPGESGTLGSWTWSVLLDDRGRTHLRITDGQYIGRFVDDDDNTHESSIEVIAAAGITKGCDPPANDRYCPTVLVSRAEMAAFILRLLGESTIGWSFQGRFSDVSANAWYAAPVERLAELGITVGYGDGTFRPEASVSRAEMAVFLARALTLPVQPAGSGQFADVQADAWYAPQAEALLAAGITAGCGTAPLRYCPAQPVPRDQMASFLARSLATP
jgi:hypothetical protein